MTYGMMRVQHLNTVIKINLFEEQDKAYFIFPQLSLGGIAITTKNMCGLTAQNGNKHPSAQMPILSVPLMARPLAE